MLDVFTSDAFSLTSLTDSINKIPYLPTRLGRDGLFTGQGVTTLTVAIEMRDGTLTLVPSAPRGAPGVNKNAPARTIRDFRMVHLPQVVHVMADEVQNVRAFGSEDTAMTVQALIDEKLAVARTDLDLTHEWQRVGALKGIVYDSDGSTVIYNYFTEFGVSQQTLDLVLDSDATKVRSKIMAAVRLVENELGGTVHSGIRAYCGDAFFDALIDHPLVVDKFLAEDAMARESRRDVRQGFLFADIEWVNYRGSLGGTPFIGTNDAYLAPLGVPALYKTFFAPANYSETVNTRGLPFYAKSEPKAFGVGVDIQAQSNPLHIVTRPRAIVKVTV